MKQSVNFVGLVTAMASMVAFAQNAPVQSAANTQSSSSPVAYVYISSTPSSGKYQINGYAAAPNGSLAAVPRSPFPTKGITNLALNSKWLFGDNGTDIYSFSIASNGAIKEVSSIDAAKYNAGATGGPEYLFLDHTGATLYNWDIYGNGTGDNDYQFFAVDQDSGALGYIGTAATSAYWLTPLAFIANNEYAYGSSCYEGTPSIYGFSRSSNGSLTDLNINPSIPSTGQKDVGYCPWWAAPDTTGHVAISLTPTSMYNPVGPARLAVYTADSDGNLTTNSSATNMPSVLVGGVNEIWAAPSGKLLAVSGVNGLQVFHYNGATPITNYTGLLTSDNVTQIWWDNDNHLYALSPAAGKLFVFTVTPTSYSEASGSPYSITGAQNLIVLPK